MRLGLILVLLLANVLVLERLIVQQSYSLFDVRKEFLVGKRMMKMFLMGSDFFLMGRAAVAQGEVHLDRWHGHQELRTTRVHTVKNLSLKVALHEKGRFIISWSNEGLEFSSRESLYFRTNNDGERIHTQLLKLKADGSLNLRLNFSGRELKISRGDDVTSVAPASDTGIWSFQGNDFPVTIDEISITDIDGTITKENFEPPFSFKISGVLILVASLYALLFFKRSWFPWLRTGAWYSFLFFTVLWLADRYHFSNFQLPHFGPPISGSQPEKRRFQFFESFLRTPVTHKALHEFYPDEQIMEGPVLCVQAKDCIDHDNAILSSPGRPRLLFVGTSQSIGSGAEKLKDTFFAKLHRKLVLQKPELISLNISVSGAHPLEMLDRYKKALVQFKPDIVLINLGHNGSAKDYETAVTEMLKTKNRKKIFLINEASTNLLKEKAVLSLLNDQLAERYHVPVVRLFQHHIEYDGKSGNIWWDIVHFNNLGHELTARFLLEEISPQI